MPACWAKQLGDADALDRLAQSHVVGQHGPAGADGKGDAVQLVGQQLCFEQLLAQRMPRGVAADFIDQRLNAALKQSLLDELFRVGIDGHLLAQPLQLG